MQQPSQKNPVSRLPPLFFVVSTLASLTLAGGVLGLFAPEVVPALAEKTVTWSLIGVAVMLEGWAIAILLGSIRRRP